MSTPTRVLFVDDDTRILSGLRRQLHSLRREWTLAFAASGHEALELLEGEPHDVIVTDMRMPIMDGAGVLAEVTRRWPRTARLVLSGHADPARMQLARSCAHRYLDKPCPVDILESEIRGALRVRTELDRRGQGGLSELWSRPPGLVDVCEDVLEAVGTDETTFEPERMFGSDPDLWRRVRDLCSLAFPDQLAGRPCVEDVVDVLHARGLFAIVMTVRLLDALVDPDAERWDDAARVGLYAAAIATQEGMSRDVVSCALMAGLLTSVDLPSMTDDLDGLTPGELVTYLVPSWGLPEPVVEALAWRVGWGGDAGPRDGRERTTMPGAAAAVMGAELVLAALGDTDLRAGERVQLERRITAHGWGERVSRWQAVCFEELGGAA